MPMISRRKSIRCAARTSFPSDSFFRRREPPTWSSRSAAPTVYSYASPRAGDGAFAAMYNHLVPDTFRIANRVDIVPKLPLPPLYDHVLGIYEVNPVLLLPLPPK